MRMKKILVPLFLALITLAFFSGCAGGPAVADPAGSVSDPAEGLSLEEGIRQIAREIETGLPQGRRIAVVNFESPSAWFSDFVLEELQGILVGNRKLVVTERSQLELLRNELSFQMSGEVSDESAVNIGHWLGAQVIVTGSLTDLGGVYRCRFNAIDLETAVRQVSAAATLRRDTALAAMLPAENASSAISPPRQDPALVTQFFNAGFAHYEAKRYGEAIGGFTRALELKPDDAASLRFRGLAYYYLKDYEKVIADYTRLIRIEPGRAEYYLTRSAAYNAKRDTDRALEDCNQALRINPNYAEAYNNRGNAYKDKGELDRAIENYNQAIRIRPRYAEAYYNRGISWHLKGEYDKAIEDCSQALRINPDFADAYTNRAAAYRNKGEYDKAIEDCNQALRINPNFVNAYNNRGAAYRSKGEYERARADWERVLQIDPGHTGARFNLAGLREMGY
jgi:tetratricopeptide (TPR) repeat protein